MKSSTVDTVLLGKIHSTEKTQKPVEGKLDTDELVIARITEGIYRQPSSALRELVSNAYDADATEVLILTDAPRFNHITVKDNGIGFTPEALTHLVKHIGGSAKRSETGKELQVTSQTDINLSPAGRQLIGKLGIGLFSVAQFTRHFLIITKTSGDSYRTIADITLRRSFKNTDGPKETSDDRQFETGHFKIWREPTPNKRSHGTEIKLLDLLPRTRDELASEDMWKRVSSTEEDEDAEKISPPDMHIGRMQKGTEDLLLQPSLPWDDDDKPHDKFLKLIDKLRTFVASDRDSVDLKKICDNYLWTLWTLALSAPLEYVEEHPFNLKGSDNFRFFKLENRLKGQAEEISVPKGSTIREVLNLKAPNGTQIKRFEVFMDGVQLFRPILYKELPQTKNAVTTPLLFIGNHLEDFGNKPTELTAGNLEFEAYLFWAPKIIPKQHQGVILRVGNASGSLFDSDFMGYETSELTRKSQVTAEIFVTKGLDGAINIDRESYNFAHPHYQYLMKWLHSAFRQFSNRHKDLGKQLRTTKLKTESASAQNRVAAKVKSALKSRGIEDIPEVIFVDQATKAELKKLRHEGNTVLSRDIVLPQSNRINTSADLERRALAEKKAIAITQLLHGMGLLDELSYENQEKLIRDIMEIVFLET